MASSASSESAELRARVIELVETSPLIAVVVQLGDGRMGRVLAASQSATLRLGRGHSLLGRYARSMIGRPVTELAMLHNGRLRAFESEVSVARGADSPIQLKVWVRAVEAMPPVAHALVMGIPARRDLTQSDTLPLNASSAASVEAIGSANAELMVDRVSADMMELLGWSTDEVLNRSLLQLVAPADIATLMVALGQVASSGRGVSIEARMRTPDGDKLCECVLVPLFPPPSVAFALSDVSERIGAGGDTSARELVARMQLRVGAARSSQQLGKLLSASQLSKLTTREWEIVERLASGDRVPAIASAMYLSQSTVRTHLSQVFVKLGVGSQQELITLLRDGRPTGSESRASVGPL